jgi:hypothetical protein
MSVLMDKITIEELRARVEYDASSGKFTWLHCDACRPCWNSRFAGKQALCAPHSNGYLFGAIANQKLFAHRAAWALHHGHWPDGEIDHINHNKTDNRIANLRVVQRTQNAMNLSKSRRNLSGVTGVFKHTQTGRWQAQIRIERRSMHLGSFESFDDAVAARRKAEEQHGFHKNHGI